MTITVSRRAFIGGAAALALCRVSGVRAQSTDVLRFGLAAFPANLQPWTQTGTAAGTIKLLIHRGLLSYDAKGNLRGELAESWSSQGPKSWLFRLRDARFHNGAKLTSADVKWSLEQIKGEKSTAFFRTEFQGVERIETPDERTVRLVTDEPIVALPMWLANYNMAMVPRGSEPNDTVGAGPFILKGQERGVSLQLEAFPGYYKPGRPRLKSIRVTTYADENLRVAALQAGDVDLIEYVPWQAMESVAQNRNLQLDAVDGPFMCLLFNGAKEPLGDARVRRAIAHAIRREEIVKAAFFGRGTPLGHLPISKDSPFFNADLQNGWTYDPGLSRKLLAEAGHPNGFSCRLLSTAQFGMLKNTAEVVQQHLGEIGIRTELNLPDWSTRVQLANRGQFDIAVHGTAADSNDPDALASFIDGGLPPALSRSCNLAIPRIQQLLKAGRAEFDPAKRKSIYHEMEKVALQEVPLAGLCWRSQGYGMKKGVGGFKNLPGQLTFFSGITLEDATIG